MVTWNKDTFTEALRTNCTREVAKVGIELIAFSEKYADTDSTKASKKMFDLAGIEYGQMIPKIKNINLEF